MRVNATTASTARSGTPLFAWLAELTRVRADSARPSVESASGLEGSVPAVALTASDEGGSAKGPVAAQCVAEGVEQHSAVVTGLVRSALASPTVRRAVACRHWRETYTATTRPDGTVVEGYVDLVYREDGGSLVVIDYKTDAVPAGALPVRAAYYRPQLQAYVDTLRSATGVADIRPVLLFLHPESGAVSVPVERT